MVELLWNYWSKAGCVSVDCRRDIFRYCRVLAAFLGIGALIFATSAVGNDAAERTYPASAADTGTVLVRFRDGTPSSVVADTIKTVKGALIRRQSRRGGVYVLKAGSRESAGSLAGELARNPAVLWAQTDVARKAIPKTIPNDLYFVNQWHLRNTAQNGAFTNRDIAASVAWDYTYGSSSVVIAILDDGFDLAHADLAANVYSNALEGVPGTDGDGNGYTNDWRGWDFVGNDNNPSAEAGDDHGTVMAGMALAVGNNSIGVAGVAYGCKLLPIRVASDAVTAGMWAEAIDYAAGKADVIAISYYIPAEPVVYEALNNALLNGRGGKGCVVLAAIGNDGVLRRYTSDCAASPEVITVSGSTTFDHKPWYADYGAPVRLVCPAGGGCDSLLTIDRTGAAGYSTNDYVYLGDFGTSPTCPQAAGVAALVLSLHPDWTSLKIRRALESSCDRIDAQAFPYGSRGSNIRYGHGRLNAGSAVPWTPGTWDGYEPDDSILSAVEITDGEFQYRSLATNNDADWVTFAVTNYTRIRFTVIGSTNVNLELYDSSTNFICGYETNWPAFCHLTTNLSAGRYYTKASGFAGAAVAEYALHYGVINFTDSYEPDNSTNNARSLSPGTMQFKTLFPTGDVDWAAFSLSSSTYIDVMTMGEWNGYLEMSLYDSGSNLLGYSYNTSAVARLTGTLGSGTYYVKVKEKDSYSVSSYQLLLETAAADANEPNNTSNQATAIVSGQRISGTIHPTNDYDWFVFELTNTANIIVLTDTINPLLDVDKFGDTIIRIYREGDDAPLGEDDDGNRGRFSAMTGYGMPAGRYCVRVASYPGTYCMDYYLALDVFDSPVDIGTFSRVTNGISLEWSGDSSFTYEIQYRDSLVGTQSWGMAERLTGRIGRNSWTDNGSGTGLNPSVATQRFYRIISR